MDNIFVTLDPARILDLPINSRLGWKMLTVFRFVVLVTTVKKL